MLASDHGHNLSFQSEHTFSNNTYKSNSNPLLAGNTRPDCSFCRAKPLIISQLQSLRDALQAKNQKIKELEGLIQKISNMAFTSTTEQDYQTLKNNSQSQPFQELTFAQCQLSPKHQSHVNSFGQSFKTDSLANSFISGSDKEVIKSSIKREVKRLNMEKGERLPPKQMQQEYPKESPLRAKLLNIMTLLPPDQHDSQMQSFQTESEPMGEGPVGLVHSKASNHKIVKHAGFIKKNEALESMHSLSSN